MTEETTVSLVRSPEGIISAEDFKAYWSVLESAYDIHLEKETIRQGLWKDYPAEDQFNQIKIKIDRVLRSMERIREIEKQSREQADSAQYETLEVWRDQLVALKTNIREEVADIINYATFGERQL